MEIFFSRNLFDILVHVVHGEIFFYKKMNYIYIYNINSDVSDLLNTRSKKRKNFINPSEKNKIT